MEMTEERVREIAREEIDKELARRAEEVKGKLLDWVNTSGCLHGPDVPR